jgi:hypothetical protein
MPKRSAKTQGDFKHTWYLREWMEQSDPPKRQADLQKQLGWSKAKAHDVWHGQQYTQALIDEIAPWLNVRSFELLLPPDVAMAIRRVRADAARIVHDSAAVNTDEPLPRSRTGRAG